LFYIEFDNTTEVSGLPGEVQAARK